MSSCSGECWKSMEGFYRRARTGPEWRKMNSHMRGPRQPRTQAGLTLGEICFVLVLVLVGVGILALVSTSMRKNVFSKNCLTNVKQLGSALVMYANDHDGYLP